MPGSLTTPGRPGARADAPECVAFHHMHAVGTQNRKLSRLNGWPMRTPVNASPTPSRATAHDSGPMWIATPSSQGTCTLYFLPVSRRFAYVFRNAYVSCRKRAVAELTISANIGLFCTACLLSGQHIRCSGLDKATIISDNPWGTANLAQFDARQEGAVSSEFLRTSLVADPRAVTVTSEQTLLSGQAAQFVFRTRRIGCYPRRHRRRSVAGTSRSGGAYPGRSPCAVCAAAAGRER
jgi:hypothetical protein